MGAIGAKISSVHSRDDGLTFATTVGRKYGPSVVPPARTRRAVCDRLGQHAAGRSSWTELIIGPRPTSSVNVLPTVIALARAAERGGA